MRLIDADKLYDWIRTECNPYGKPTIDFESGNRMLDMVKRMPIACMTLWNMTMPQRLK